MPAPNKPRNKNNRKNPRTKVIVAPRNNGLLGIFPSRLTTTLPYADQFNLQGATLSAAFGTERAFRLNSLFDPDFTSTGHQPYGFDQVTPFYNKYLVDEVDVTVSFSDPGGDGLYVGVFIKGFNDTSTLTGASISQAMERPLVFCKPLNNTGSQVVVYKRKIRLWEVLGLTKSQYNDCWQQTASAVTTNPSLVPYLSISVADANASSPALTCKATIEFKFHVVFWERAMSAAQS